MLRPKKIHTRNLIANKNTCVSKIPHSPPPENFSNGPSLTSLSFNKNHCLKSNFVTVQFSLIYVASVKAAIDSSKSGSVNH